MKTKMSIDKVLDKYVIVVDGDEEKVVYDVDDSRIFSVHITGCGRGARNAVLSRKTFKTVEEADKDIKYLNTCHWTYKFKAIKVSDLKGISEKGWNILVDDIEDYNWDVDFEKEMKAKRDKEEKAKYLELKKKATDLIGCGLIYSIDENEEDNYVLIRVYK
jgi:hypothetical protein